MNSLNKNRDSLTNWIHFLDESQYVINRTTTYRYAYIFILMIIIVVIVQSGKWRGLD